MILLVGEASDERKYDPLVYRLLAAAYGWPPAVIDALDHADLNRAIASIVQHA